MKRDAALSGDVSFSSPADLGKVWYVSLQLMTNGTEASGGTVYEWVHLINPPAETPKVDFPIEIEVGAAKDAAASLLDSAPSSFEAATQGSVISQTSITEDELLKIISRTSSAIAFEQKLTEKGGALVVGKLTLPYNNTSLSGESLPPLNAENSSYKVFKHFKYGGWVNLSDSDLGIVDVSGDGAKITATLVIIDGVPGNESDVINPVGGMDCCGVKLVTEKTSGEKYLFIYDGNEDGVALDPIALENYSAGGESDGGGGGGGCNAGIPLAGLLSLCGLALCLRKKH